MMYFCNKQVIIAACILGILTSVSIAAETSTDRDEEILLGAGIKIDAESLTKLLRNRTPDGMDLKQLAHMVDQWKSDDFKKREEATGSMLKWGQIVREAVEKASKDSDVEVAQRARDVLKQINREIHLAQPILAVRVLAKRWPAKAVEPLLLHLPFADEPTAEEIVFSLDALTVKEGNVPEAIVKALCEKSTERRAAAAVIVGRRGQAEQRVAVKKLLDDVEPTVRLRAAQGLLAARDTSGLATLVALLDETDVHISWSAEELLHWVAGDTAPQAIVGGATADERKKCRDAWETWLTKYRDIVDVAKCYAEVRRPGLFLASAEDRETDPKNGRVFLRGCDGKARWEIRLPLPKEDSLFVHDAFLLPGNRVSLVNSEWDLQGRKLWGFRFDLGDCSRLPNGNIFFSARDDRISEYTRAGEPLENFSLLTDQQGPEHSLLGFNFGASALLRKLGDGRLIWFCREIGLGEHDVETGRLVRKVPLDPKLKFPRPLDVLPNGHWLCGLDLNLFSETEKKPWLKLRWDFVEVDSNGQVVWQSRIWADWAVQLRNGRTVVLSKFLVPGWQPSPAVVELDRTGKRLSEEYTRERITRIRVCLPLLGLGFEEPPTTEVPEFESVEYRLKGLKDKDAKVRQRSLAYLEFMGPEVWMGIIPELIDAMGDLDPPSRQHDTPNRQRAEQLLKWLGRPALSPALKALDDKNAGIRAGGLEILGYLMATKIMSQEEAKEIVKKVIVRVQDEEVIVRRNAINAVCQFKKISDEVIPTLVLALKDKDVGKGNQQMSVAALAASYLGYMGQPTPQVMSALTEASQSSNEGLKYTANQALLKLEAKQPPKK
jgi:HEAT repeat protein